jgi:poly-gamma-glutamate capsule biosynthesis protein CapA/YwtB (metallophosphatase superfamily)
VDDTLLFLAGDVMTGRGIDQVLAQPSAPRLHEPYVHDAREYVALAERANGAIPAPVSSEYVWGDALDVLERARPLLRIVNLETAVTTSDAAWPGKGIHYRMHPANVGCLSAARIDACALANNHVLDWGHPGLRETLGSLQRAGLRTAGAGIDLDAALAPAVLPLHQGSRLLLFARATASSGVPAAWEAGTHRAGIALLPDLSEATARRLAEQVAGQRLEDDIVIVSLHWGGNWVAEVPAEHRAFARLLIDLHAADLVHGHSSHHPLPIEVYRGKLILYGCGDLINDYEGIGMHDGQRSDVGCLYLPALRGGGGRLQALRIVPMQLRRFRLGPADDDARRWVAGQLDRAGRWPGSWLEAQGDGSWLLRWRQA